jgi:DHA1 family bicyclomycin/chloramphenicol resistance-like MFS transporter
MGKSLNASPPAVQMSLMAFFITIGVCQLFYGPLSDIVGRKTPIYAGLIIFALGSIGCALAPNINVLIGFRALQGFGACAPGWSSPAPSFATCTPATRRRA